MTVCLNGEWTLAWREEGAGDWEKLARVPARVPGNIEIDVCAAGIEPDMYFGENQRAYTKYELYEFLYEREFSAPGEFRGARVNLRLEGVNNIADIYINGALVGRTENALIAHEIDITRAIRPGDMNSISVHIHSALNWARERDYPVSVSANEGSDEYTRLRMPPHSFGWDIMPRFLSAGLWRGVYVETVKPARLTQVYFATLSVSERAARVKFKYRFTAPDARLDGYGVRVYMDGERVLERPARFLSGEADIVIDNPRLWWPLGYGEAALYETRTELIKHGEVVDARSERTGIRTIDIETNMRADDAGEFLVRVNGCPVLVKGSNWVPLDAMHSRDAARYAPALELFRQAGCNMARCWGGNVYEDHEFYSLCDEYGIMVWQDFAMACAVYPQDEDFLRRLSDEAVYVIRKLRNHPCIALWAGDNEVDETYAGLGYAPESNRYNAATREVLPRAVRENDPYRMYLPSSPYIDKGIERYQVPEQHLWGARAYFKDEFYKNASAHFVSECGYHGCPAPESIAKFIPEAEIWPMGGGAWRAHNTETHAARPRGYDRNQLMADQVRVMFADVPDTLNMFAALSQISQAEAVKFFIERTRALKWRRTGILWWNMLDGWPQISDAVVDWYFVKKRAFNYIRRAQAPITLVADEPSGWNMDILLVNDSRVSARGNYCVTDADTGEELASGEMYTRANENARAATIRLIPGEKRLLLLKWASGGRAARNHVITGFPPYDYERMLKWCDIIDNMESGDT